MEREGPSQRPTAPQPFPLADLAKWATEKAQPKRFIMPGFIPAQELTLATGAGGANKSTFGQQLATCCAAGRSMLGIAVQNVTALYITAEDDEDRLHWMQEHICRALNVPMASLEACYTLHPCAVGWAMSYVPMTLGC